MHLIESWVFPLLPMNGVSRGTISSFTATLPVIGTGECKRRVSRMTASRYGRPAKSSIVGLLVAICKSSLRSWFWISGCCASERMAHVVPVLVVPLPTTINHHKKGAFEPCPYDRWMIISPAITNVRISVIVRRVMSHETKER
jgi:hypothetical protein